MTAAAIQALFWGAFGFAVWATVSSIRNALPTIRQALEREEAERHGS